MGIWWPWPPPLPRVFLFIAVFYLNSRDHLLSINLKGFVFDREITAKTVKIGIPSYPDVGGVGGNAGIVP